MGLCDVGPPGWRSGVTSGPREPNTELLAIAVPPRLALPKSALGSKWRRLIGWRLPRLRIPWIPVSLVVAGLLVHYQWLTTTPLTAGDWSWASDEKLRTWFPWPTVWDPTTGFGVKDFAGSYVFPVEAALGLLRNVGVTWGLGEKLAFFWPFAALSFFAPWLFAGEILRSPRWALLSALIYASSTYLLLVSTGGQLLVAMAAVLAPLVLWAFVRALRRLSVADALLAGLLVAVQAAYEVRITYLTGLLCALYLLILIIHQPDFRIAVHRARLAALPALILLGTQLYWLVPLATYRGDHGLPIASAPFQAFMRISHGITGAHPFWTGAAPTIFHVVVLNPVFFVFPLVAFAVLLIRRGQREVLWLCLAALMSAFLIKQDNPPFGGVYDWLFYHFPGWSLFREASKLFFIVALSYAVLIPMCLRQLGGIRIHPMEALARRQFPPAFSQRVPADQIRVHPLLVRATRFDVFVTHDGRFVSQYDGRERSSITREGLYRTLMRLTKPPNRFVSATLRVLGGLSPFLRGLAPVFGTVLSPAKRELERLPQIAAVAGLLTITALSANNFIPVLTGQTGYTTQPWQEPSSFIALTKMLESDRRSGPALWLGGASVGSTRDSVRHLFPVASPAHPLVELSGLDYNDVLTPYCPSSLLHFCYLDPELFPYLLDRLGVAYVVAPAGDEVGTLPVDVSYQALLGSIGQILGQPRVLGTGSAALAVWQINGDVRPVTLSAAVAVVDGSVQRTKDALPALQALNIPGIYRFGDLTSPGASVPGPAIEVVPGVEGYYNLRSGGSFALLAQAVAPTLPISIGTQPAILPRLVPSSTSYGWSIYGPANLQPGLARLTATEGSRLGPLVAWSSPAMEVLQGERAAGLPPTVSGAEGLTAEGAPSGAHWVELRRTYDSGWSMTSASAHLRGDSIFNLYWAPNLSGTVTFRFSTAPWEGLGVGFALTVAFIVLGVWLRKRRGVHPNSTTEDLPEGDRPAQGVAFQAALVGIALIVIAAISQAVGWWSGSENAYSITEFQVALAMLALTVSVVAQLAGLYAEARKRSSEPLARPAIQLTDKPL